jgi:hypothetical protein
MDRAWSGEASFRVQESVDFPGLKQVGRMVYRTDVVQGRGGPGPVSRPGLGDEPIILTRSRLYGPALDQKVVQLQARHGASPLDYRRSISRAAITRMISLVPSRI